MPDHVHLVVTARCTDSDLKRLITRAKQYAGFHFKKATQQRLWQRYGYERVLRNEEERIALIAYVIQPGRTRRVAAGLSVLGFFGVLTRGTARFPQHRVQVSGWAA
jgi:hypothetical protein